MNSNDIKNIKLFLLDMDGTIYLDDRLFDGVIDTVSVSLNAASAEEYDKTCKSIYGIRAYEIMLDFAKKAKAHTDVVLSIVDVLPPEEIEACRKIAAEAGVRLKVREYVEE